MSTYLHFTHSSRNNIGIVTPLVLEQCLISYSLMSATIPCLKGFVKRFTTGGIGYTIDASQNYSMSGSRSRGRGQGGSYALQSLDGKGRGQGDEGVGAREGDGGGMRLRPDTGGYARKVEVAGGKGERREREGSLNSDSSQHMIIHRQVEWDVSET